MYLSDLSPCDLLSYIVILMSGVQLQRYASPNHKSVCRCVAVAEALLVRKLLVKRYTDSTAAVLRPHCCHTACIKRSIHNFRCEILNTSTHCCTLLTAVSTPTITPIISKLLGITQLALKAKATIPGTAEHTAGLGRKIVTWVPHRLLTY